MRCADIVIIGAGVAGLGAANFCHSAGQHAIVLEASGRVGGRARTDYPAVLGGAWFDAGAVWFHDAENNPLTAIARAAGDTLLRSDEMRTERTFIGDRPADRAELTAYDAAWGHYAASARAIVAAEGDVPLSEIARRLPADPWALTVEAWEGPVICATDANRFSTQDWLRNALGGTNLVPEGGIGHFVERRLTPGLDIRLNTPITRVRWNRPSGQVRLEGPNGTIEAAACIVTVSTGVLASDTIAFDPPLPPDVYDAIHALPMGLAIKVVLRAAGPDRLDLPAHTSVDRMVQRPGDVLMPLQCWPFGRDYVQGWIGGSAAWNLAHAGEAATVDFALSYLRDIFGSRANTLFARGPTLVTHWDLEPWVRGAYSYATPGSADARITLATPIADGHLTFAGEACHVGYTGTVAGAWLSGQAAAKAALAAIG